MNHRASCARNHILPSLTLQNRVAGDVQAAEYSGTVSAFLAVGGNPVVEIWISS